MRSLEAYAVDTFNLKYRRRLLIVPSCEYPSIDDAMASLQMNAGGYTIKLLPNSHHVMSANLCNTIDDLVIEGDCDPFSGMWYSNRCVSEDGTGLPDPVRPFPLCHTRVSSKTGAGPFSLVVNGSSIAVYGHNLRGERDPQRDPCFNDICQRRVILFSATGELIEATAEGRGNVITVDVTIPFTDVAEPAQRRGTFELYRRKCSGFGFFFPPSVTLTATGANPSINTIERVRIVGVTLDLPSLFFYGSKGGEASLAGCWIKNNVAFYARFFCDDSNVWTGLCYCLAASSGTLNNQAWVGPNAHLTVDASLASVNYSLFASTVHAIECTNGGTLMLLGCEIVNNCIGLTAYQGATVSIPDCRFCCNLYSMYAAYQSRITSNPVNVPGVDTSRAFSSPWFVHNVFIFIASMNSFIIVPNIRATQNLVPGILDGEVHTTMESIHIDMIGQKGSSFIHLPSASTPSPVGLGCRDKTNIPGSLAQSYLINLLNANSWNVTTPSFIRSIVGESQNSVSASETLTTLSSDMSQDNIDHSSIGF